MSVTSYVLLSAASATELSALVSAALLAGKQPYGETFADHTKGTLNQAVITGAPVSNDQAIDATALTDRLDALEADDTSVGSRLDALEAADTAAVGRLGDLETTVDTAVTGLSAVVADHTAELSGHETRINALENP